MISAKLIEIQNVVSIDARQKSDYFWLPGVHRFHNDNFQSLKTDVKTVKSVLHNSKFCCSIHCDLEFNIATAVNAGFMC